MVKHKLIVHICEKLKLLVLLMSFRLLFPDLTRSPRPTHRLSLLSSAEREMSTAKVRWCSAAGE